MIQFTGELTLGAQQLYDLLTEAGASEEAAARIVLTLQQHQPTAEPQTHLGEPLGERKASTSEGRCWISRDGTGIVMRVTKVDDSYAYMERVDGKGRWAMPVKDYTAPKFSEQWREATLAEVMSTAGAPQTY